VSSTARGVEGVFPMSSFVSTITAGGIRGYDNTVDYTDSKIDPDWKNAKEGEVSDNNENGVDDNEDLKTMRISDNGTWLNLYVETFAALQACVHFYIDVDGDGTADFDVVFDNDNSTVRLYSYNGSAWSEVSLANKDRYDMDRKEKKLEMGIEFSYLNLTSTQTINYYTTTEGDPEPGGAVKDRGPDNNWSPDYTTIPEFRDILVPMIGSVLLIVVLRRKRGIGGPCAGRRPDGERWGIK